MFTKRVYKLQELIRATRGLVVTCEPRLVDSVLATGIPPIYVAKNTAGKIIELFNGNDLLSCLDEHLDDLAIGGNWVKHHALTSAEVIVFQTVTSKSGSLDREREVVRDVLGWSVSK